MSFTPEALLSKGFMIQPDGSYSKETGEASYGLPLSVQPVGGVGESHSPNTSTPRQPVAHENERQLQEQIANWLRLHDTWFTRSRMDRKTTNTVSTPDFLLAVNGIPIAIEAKMFGHDLSDEQEQTRRKMVANGWNYWRVYRLEEVIAGIRLIQEKS